MTHLITLVHLGEPLPDDRPIIFLDGVRIVKPSHQPNLYEHSVAYLEEHLRIPVAVAIPTHRDGHAPTGDQTEVSWQRYLLSGQNSLVIMLFTYANTQLWLDLCNVFTGDYVAICMLSRDPDVELIDDHARLYGLPRFTSIDDALDWAIDRAEQD